MGIILGAALAVSIRANAAPSGPVAPTQEQQQGADAFAETAFVSPVTVLAACPAPNIPQSAVAPCAQAAALLQALRRAAVALPKNVGIRLGLPQQELHLALAAQLYTPLVRCLPDNTCAVTLLLRPNAQQTVNESLCAQHLLQARGQLLQATEKLLHAAAALPPATRGSSWFRARVSPPDAPQPQREATLADHLDALYLAQGSLRLSKSGWLVDAQSLPVLEEATHKLHDNALLRLLLAEAQLQRNMPQQSIHSCTQALQLDPGMSRARYIRALAHWRLEQTGLAESDLTASLEYAPLLSDQEKARRLRARGALRMLRNASNMCSDFSNACALGDCEGLAQARSRGFCLPEAITTETAQPMRPASTQP